MSRCVKGNKLKTSFKQWCDKAAHLRATTTPAMQQQNGFITIAPLVSRDRAVFVRYSNKLGALSPLPFPLGFRVFG